MVAAISMNGIYNDQNSSPCLCLDSKISCSMNIKSNSMEMWQFKKPKSVDFLSSSFLDSWYYFRISAKMLSSSQFDCTRTTNKQRFRKLSVVNELGGQYEETFNDVKLVRKLL